MQDSEVPHEVLERIVRLIRQAKDDSDAVELLLAHEVEFVRAAAPYHITIVGMAKSREAQELVFGKVKAHLAWVSGTLALGFTLRDQISAFLGGFLK